MYLYRFGFLSAVLLQTVSANETPCIEGILFKAEIKCALVAPNRRINIQVSPQWILLPDRVICVGMSYPVFLWIESHAIEQDLIGSHVTVRGCVRECLHGEFLIHAEQITVSERSSKEVRPERELTEEEMRYWEEQIPRMASAALHQEGIRALFKGFDVVESRDHALWIVHPDGTETFLKHL